jgi:hypothetical protein
VRVRKASSMISSVNQQNSNMNNGKGKEQTTLDSLRSKKINRNAVISKHLSIITLNVKGLNSAIKRHRF